MLSFVDLFVSFERNFKRDAVVWHSFHFARRPMPLVLYFSTHFKRVSAVRFSDHVYSYVSKQRLPSYLFSRVFAEEVCRIHSTIAKYR